MARRIVPARRAGLTLDSPFKRGDTAEKVLAKRLRDYAAAAEERRRKRGAAGPGRRANPGSVRPSNTPRSLRRLYRALARRKTLAARQRLQQRIRQLEKELS